MMIIFASGLLLSAQQGDSLNFDGTDDQVNCGNHSSIRITGNSLTIEARVNIDAFSSVYWAGTILTKGQSSGNTGGYGFRTGGSGELSFFFGNGSAWPEVLSPAGVLTLGTWHHVAATYDGSMMRLYVDGVQVANQSETSAISTSTSDLRLGESAFAGRLIDATMDEVRIWNVTRTPTEINVNKDIEISSSQTGLVAYYKFNQGTGGANNTTETIATDELGNSDGTLINFTLNGSASNWVTNGALSLEDDALNTVLLNKNPVTNELSLDNTSLQTGYQIYDVAGREVLSGTVLNGVIKVNSITPGVYILKLEENAAVRFVKN